jgi:hypothetical protein
MTAIALPRPRRKRSKPAQVAKTVAKAWTAMKIGSTAAKAAKKGAKTAAKFKVVKFFGRKGGKVLLVPIAAGGGLVAWKKVRSSSSTEGPATPYGSGVGPAATPATVTPPKTAPGTGAHNGEGALNDPPSGSANPPTGPAPGATS